MTTLAWLVAVGLVGFVAETLLTEVGRTGQAKMVGLVTFVVVIGVVLDMVLDLMRTVMTLAP